MPRTPRHSLLKPLWAATFRPIQVIDYPEDNNAIGELPVKMTTFETNEAKNIMMALVDALRKDVENQEGADAPEVAFQMGKFESVASGENAYGLSAVVLTGCDRYVATVPRRYPEYLVFGRHPAETQCEERAVRIKPPADGYPNLN